MNQAILFDLKYMSADIDRVIRIENEPWTGPVLEGDQVKPRTRLIPAMEIAGRVRACPPDST
jgi:hypothetical protein